jgi:hypothetical protein
VNGTRNRVAPAASVTSNALQRIAARGDQFGPHGARRGERFQIGFLRLSELEAELVACLVGAVVEMEKEVGHCGFPYACGDYRRVNARAIVGETLNKKNRMSLQPSQSPFKRL